MDIAQLPNLPEKTSESSESSDSESESKENSGRSENRRTPSERALGGGVGGGQCEMNLQVPSSCVSSRAA